MALVPVQVWWIVKVYGKMRRYDSQFIIRAKFKDFAEATVFLKESAAYPTTSRMEVQRKVYCWVEE